VKSSKLGVEVVGDEAGHLLKEAGEFIFNYTSDKPCNFISLTMPVRGKGYVHPYLLPIFEMHLPEGYLLAVIKKQFAKLTATDDFGLLHLMSPNVKGRVNYQSASKATIEPLRLDDVLHPKHPQLFNELLLRFAMTTPLSGVQPKVLAQIENKATLKLDDYIVKAWGADYPQLALNEYFCMMVVQLAGIDVPEFYLSDDDRLFIMKRFDIDERGKYLGFEDMCVLQAKQRDDKYVGSYEQVAKSIKTFTSGRYKEHSLQQFFKMIVLNNTLQNGDAHLKNFGLIYEDLNDIRLAPAYDIVSTTAYIENDIAALTLLGSKKWWGRKFLIRFGVESCDLTLKRANQLYSECERALAQVLTVVEERLVREEVEGKRKVLKHLASLMA